MNYPDFYKLFGQTEFTWNKIRQQNRNPLLAMLTGADGLKTGFTKEAGYGLVGSAVQDGLRLIVVVNGDKTAKERADEAKKLLEWGFHNFEQRVLFAQGADARQRQGLSAAPTAHVPLQADGPGDDHGAEGRRRAADRAHRLSGPVPAPVKEGQPIGKLKVWRNDKVVLEAAAAGRRQRRARAIFRSARSTPCTELVIALFRAGAERL